MTDKATKKTKNEKGEKTEKKRGPFQIPKPIPIPTENRHLCKKPNPNPTDCQKSSPQGSSHD
jgi:hypothetical protein